MKQINIVIMNENLPKVNEAIIDLECLHPIGVENFGEWANKLDNFYTIATLTEFKSLHNRIHKLADNIRFEIKYDPDMVKIMKEQASTLNFDSINFKIKDLETQYHSLSERKKNLEHKLSNNEELDSQYNVFKDFLDLTGVSGYTVLDQFLGQIPTAKVSELNEFLANTPHLYLTVRENPGWTIFVLFVLKKDGQKVGEFLKQQNFQQVTIPSQLKGSPKQVLDRIRREFDSINIERSNLTKREEQLVSKIKEALPLYAHYTHFQELLFESQQYFKKTSRTCVISGWIANEKLNQLISSVKKITAGKCYFEICDPKSFKIEKIQVPFQFKNNRFIKPFEILIKIYGIPKYGCIDPTLIFALSYMFMFGYMFGDVGDGSCLVILGAILSLNKKLKQNIRNMGILLIYCGAISILFGVLYGSIFGVETLFPALWISPMHHMNELLKIGLLFGIGIISFGIIINIINCIRLRNWSKAIFDKAGLVGGIFYWGMLGLIAKTVVLGHHTAGWMWGLFIGLPVILILLKIPFEKIAKIKKEHKQEGLLTQFMEVFFEIIELFQVYTSNTFSFLRVGAFALSHAGLFIAIFSMIDLFKDVKFGGFFSILILFFGNILVLALEGMVVAIQSIRLEYYEFFTKFFVGEGELYKPISIRENI